MWSWCCSCLHGLFPSRISGTLFQKSFSMVTSFWNNNKVSEWGSINDQGLISSLNYPYSHKTAAEAGQDNVFEKAIYLFDMLLDIVRYIPCLLLLQPIHHVCLQEQNTHICIIARHRLTKIIDWHNIHIIHAYIDTYNWKRFKTLYLCTDY